MSRQAPLHVLYSYLATVAVPFSPSSPSSLFSSSVREVKYTYQSYSQRYHQLFALPLIVKVPRVGCTYTVFSTLPS